MSYAKNRERGSGSTVFNHFVVHNTRDVVGCHDFEVYHFFKTPLCIQI